MALILINFIAFISVCKYNSVISHLNVFIINCIQFVHRNSGKFFIHELMKLLSLHMN